MATPLSTTAEVDGRVTRRSCRDTLLDSLAREVDSSPGQLLSSDKWSSEELLASCQALLEEEEARGTVAPPEVPSPADDQCLPRCPHPRGQTRQHCQKHMSPTDPLPPPVSSDALLSSSETSHTAFPAVVHAEPASVASHPERLELLQEAPAHEHSCHQEVLSHRRSPSPVRSPAQQMAASERPVARPLAEQSLTTRGEAPAEKVALGRLVLYHLASPLKLRLEQVPSLEPLPSPVRSSPEQLPSSLKSSSSQFSSSPVGSSDRISPAVTSVKSSSDQLSLPVTYPPVLSSPPVKSPPARLAPSLTSPTDHLSPSVESSSGHLSPPVKSPPEQLSSSDSPPRQLSPTVASPLELLSPPLKSPPRQLSPPVDSPPEQLSPLLETPPGQLSPPLDKEAPLDGSPSTLASLALTALGQSRRQQSSWTDGDGSLASAVETCRSAGSLLQTDSVSVSLQPQHQPTWGCHSHARRRLCHVQQEGICGASDSDDSPPSVDCPHGDMNTTTSSPAHTTGGCQSSCHVHEPFPCHPLRRTRYSVSTPETCDLSSPASLPCSHDSPGFTPSPVTAAGSSFASAGFTCSPASTTVTADVNSQGNALAQTCSVDSVCHTFLPAAPDGYKVTPGDLQEEGTSLNQGTESLLSLPRGVCVDASSWPGGVQPVSHAWPLDGSSSSVSSSCPSIDNLVIGETLVSDSEDDESLFTFKTCSSGDNESGSVGGEGTWFSCGEVFSTDGSAATDADSEYSLGRFAPSSEDLWQWNPSYGDDDEEPSPVIPAGDGAGYVRTMASQVLLGQGAAHCQALLHRSQSGHCVDVGSGRQALRTLSEGGRLTHMRSDSLPWVETKGDTTEGLRGCHTAYPPHTVSCASAGGAGGGAHCLSLASHGASGILTPALAGDSVGSVSRDDAASREHATPPLPRCLTPGEELVDVVRRRAARAVVGEGTTAAAVVRKDGSPPPHTLPPVPHELCRHHQAPRRPLVLHPTESLRHDAPCVTTSKSCVTPHRHNTEEQNMMKDVFSDSDRTLRKNDQKQTNLAGVDEPDLSGDCFNSSGRCPPPAVVPKVPEAEATPQDHTVRSEDFVTVHDQESSVVDTDASVLEGNAGGETVICGLGDIMEVCSGHYGVCSESDVKCVARGKARPPLAEAPVLDSIATGAVLPLAPWCRPSAVSGPKPAVGNPPADALPAGAPPAGNPTAAYTAAGPSVNATPQVLTASRPLPSRPQQLPQLSSPPPTTRADPTCTALPRSGSVACQPSLDSPGAPLGSYSLFSSQDCRGKSAVTFPEGSSRSPSFAGVKISEAEMKAKGNIDREEACEALSDGGVEGGGCVVAGREKGSMVSAPTLPGIDYRGATLTCASLCAPDSPSGLPWSPDRRSSSDDRADRIGVRGQHQSECGVRSEQDERDSWQQRGDAGQEQRDRRLRGVRREWRLVRPHPAALPQDNLPRHRHLLPTRFACPPVPFVDGSLGNRNSANQGEEEHDEKSGDGTVPLDWCDLACWLQGSECQAPRRTGTGGPGWTGSCGHGTVGEAHVARCPGEVIGSLQVLVGDVLWHYPLYGTVEQCCHDAEDEWELVQAGQGWHTAINSGGELVTMSSDNNSVAGAASSSTALQPQPSTVANLHAPVHGYKVVSKEQAKVKSLLPVFADGKSSSARDISSSVTFRVKGDSTWQTQRPNRNSDVCDVHMYRGPDSRGGTPGLPEEGDGGAVIKLCGVSLGSRPASPDPYPLFRCHTLPRKAPHLRLSSLPPWPQAPLESPVTSPESEVAMSAPTSPRLSQVPCAALQDNHVTPPGSSVTSGTPVDNRSRDNVAVSAGDGCLSGSVGASDGGGGGDPPEPPAIGTAPPRPPAPSFYQWCHTFARSREANRESANHSSEHASTALPWTVPGPPLRTTSRCGRGTVTPRPYTGGRTSQLLHQALPNAREEEEEGVAGACAGPDAMAPCSLYGIGRSPPSQHAGSEPPPAGAPRQETCRAKFQPLQPVAGRQNHLLDSLVEASGSRGGSTGDMITGGEDVRSGTAAVDLTTRRSRPATSQMTSADTSLTVSHPPPPPDDSRFAAPILPPDVSPLVPLMGSTDSPDRCRQPVERGARDGAPTVALEDRRVTTTGAGTPRDLPVWLRIMKSSAAQCSVPSQAPVPQPPVRSSSKLEAITTGIRESGSAHNGTNMPKTLPKKYPLPAGLAQADNTQLCPTPKWLLTDKAELSNNKDGTSQEAPAVEESCYNQKEAAQEVAPLTEPFYKLASEEACHSQKESQTATTAAEPSPRQKVPPQAVASIPKLSHRLKEPLQAVAVKADPCPSQALNVTAKPFCKEKGPTQVATGMAESVSDRKDPCVVMGATTIPLEKKMPQVLVESAETCHNHTAPPQAVTTTVEPCSQREPPQVVTSTVGPCSRGGPSQVLTTSAGPCSQRRPSQAVTKSPEFYPSQKAKPQAATALAEPCNSQRGPSKGVITSLEFSRDQEGSLQVVAVRLEPYGGQTGPSQAVGATAEPHLRQQSETVTNKDYHSQRGPPQIAKAANKDFPRQREPSQAGNALKEGPSQAGTPIKASLLIQKGPSQKAANADEGLHNQVQPFQMVTATSSVGLSQEEPSEAMTATNEVCLSQAGPSKAMTATNDVCLSQGGPSEAMTATNDVRHSLRESATQALDITKMTTGQCPPKSSTTDTQPSFASSTGEVPLSRDLDLTHPHTLSSLPSHDQEDNPDTGSFPSSDAFDSAVDSCSPGLDGIREILSKEEKGVYICSEPRRDLVGISENTERVEEPDLVRNLSSCLSGSVAQERTGSLSGEDDVTMRDKTLGGLLASTELRERQGITGSGEEGVGVGQESCGAARGSEANEQAQLVTSQTGGETGPRSTRFPLDVICGTKISWQRDGEHSPSRLPRQRLSSVDHVQLLTPGPAHGNSSSRSKSTSRIGSRTTDAAEGAVLHTLAFDAFGRGAREAPVASNPENDTTPSPLVIRPPILPLDTVLENKIKLTIDSCTVNQVDGDTVQVPPATHLPEDGTSCSPEGSEASQSGDATSHLNEMGRSVSDAPTYCVSVNKTLPELLKDVSVKDDAGKSRTVVPYDAVDDVVMLGNKKDKEAEEIHLKGDILVGDVCSGGVRDVGEDASNAHFKKNHGHMPPPPPPHSSGRSQDSTRTKVLPDGVSDSVARVMAGLTDPDLQLEAVDSDVKKPRTSVIQGEELAARRESLSGQGRDDVHQHQCNLGTLSSGQQQERQLQEECKASEKEEGEAVSAVLIPTTGLFLETPPHQPDPTATEEPSHVTDSSGRTSLLQDKRPGLLYADECESGLDVGKETPREVSENIPAHGQEEFDEMQKSGCSLTEVGGGLRGQNVDDATHPSLQSFGSPQWIQTLDEKCTVNTAESLLEGAITLRIGSHDERRVDSYGDEIQQPLCVVVQGTVESPPVVEDTAESPPAECGEHGTATMREQSVEEYEQALEVVTPEPSHGFSQSSASVATVVRVDTPCDTHTHLPPEDEEAEEEFVDASDRMDLDKGDAELVGEVTRGEDHLDTHRSSPSLAQPIALVGATPHEEAMTGTLSMTASDTQSSGTSHTSSVDMCGTRSAGIISDPAVSTSGSVSEPVCQDSTQQSVMTGRRGSDMPEDGSTSSGGHITDPDMLASASASSTGSETWWTSGGGPAGQRDLLPLDKDEDEAQWRALLAVNLPDTEEEPTGYESDEDFDTVDADMRRLEEKLRKFERELGQNSEEDSVPENGEKASTVPPQDPESLQISSLPRVFPAGSSAKTKHLSLMTRLEVQEYEDSTSESDSESEAASSSDSADFLFVKTKIKLKPGDRKCRSLDEKRSKNYNLNKSREDRRRASRVKENSCVCEEQLDLSNLNLHLGTVVEEVVSVGREEAQVTSVVAAKETVSAIQPGSDEPEECPDTARPGDPRPADVGQLMTGVEDANGVMLCGGEDHLLLGYIWHEEDGMAAVDFEGLEDFKNFEGQGALMIMYEDDHDDKLNDEDVMTGPPGGLPEYLAEESECESSWSRGSSCGASVSSPHQSSKGLEKTFLAAFKSSLRKASKYLGPKMESRSRKRGDQSPAMSQDSSELVDSTQLSTDLPYQRRRCSIGVDDDSSAGVYNVQSGRVAPVSAIPTSDSEGPDAFSCSSGEYYAAPALCVNTSDEDPAAVSALARGIHSQQPQDPCHEAHRSVHNRACDTSGPPPMPPPRWVQRRSYVPQNLDAGLLNQCLSSSSEGHGRSAAATLSQPQPTPQPSLRTTSQKATYSSPTSSTHVHSPVESFTNGKETYPYVVGVTSNAPGEGKTNKPFVAPGLSVRLAEDGEPAEPGALPPLPAPPLYADDTPPGGSWLPHGYPHFTVPNHGNYSCVVPSHRHLRGDADLPVDTPLHIGDASPTVPSRKPVSVKQLKRKQQEKVLHREAEEGLEALGCTYCMGVPQMRGRPPEDASHWRQSSPHPRAISDRRSWPPRVSCLVPLTSWSLPALTCSNLPPQPQTPAGQPCLYFSRAVIAAVGPACPHHCPSNSHDLPHRVLPPRVCRTCARSTPGSADSHISLGEEPRTDTSSHRSLGPTSSPGSDSDPLWTPVVCLGSSHRPQPPACHAPTTVTPSSPSTNPCLSQTNPALTTDFWTPSMEITPYHYLYAHTSELTSEFWAPGVEHSPLTPTESHHPVLSKALWPPLGNTSRHEGEEVPLRSDCWPPLAGARSLTHQQEYSYCGDSGHTGGDATNIPPVVPKPLSASTSAVRWPKAVVPLTLPQAAPLPTCSCPLLIFMSVLDLTGEHVTPEHARDPTTTTLSSQGPHHPPTPSTHSRPPAWAAASNSNSSSVEWDPFLKYSASESDVDSG